jgi:hypothetical protein
MTSTDMELATPLLPSVKENSSTQVVARSSGRQERQVSMFLFEHVHLLNAKGCFRELSMVLHDRRLQTLSADGKRRKRLTADLVPVISCPLQDDIDSDAMVVDVVEVKNIMNYRPALAQLLEYPALLSASPDKRSLAIPQSNDEKANGIVKSCRTNGFKPFQTLPNPRFQTFQTFSNPFKPTVSNLSNLFKPCQTHGVKPFKPFQAFSNLPQSMIFKPFKPFKPFSNPFQTLSNLSNPFQTFFKSTLLFGVSCRGVDGLAVVVGGYVWRIACLALLIFPFIRMYPLACVGSKRVCGGRWGGVVPCGAVCRLCYMLVPFLHWISHK